MSLQLYLNTSYKVSEIITKFYSTSFSLATYFLEKEKRCAIYAIYGFVRLADEIVDSFSGYDKSFLLNKLKEDLYYALENGISTNLVLMSFADVVRKYGITKEQINSFLRSMEYDLTKNNYTSQQEMNEYVYGSADVVGLMCLKIFCEENYVLYNKLEYYARKLGSAFQKVNFLRDLNDDVYKLNRVYFPEINNIDFDDKIKESIEAVIELDFKEAYKGIQQLPGKSKLAVAIAYFYYKSLLKKIKRTKAEIILSKRIRISNLHKFLILIKVLILYKLRLI